MTLEAKLAMLKTILGISGTSEDALLTVYLNSVKQALLSWKYEYTAESNRPTEVPETEEQNQIWAVVAGYSQRGYEGQTSATENGMGGQWAYSDMLHYIRSTVVPVAGVM